MINVKCPMCGRFIPRAVVPKLKIRKTWVLGHGNPRGRRGPQPVEKLGPAEVSKWSPALFRHFKHLILGMAKWLYDLGLLDKLDVVEARLEALGRGMVDRLRSRPDVLNSLQSIQPGVQQIRLQPTDIILGTDWASVVKPSNVTDGGVIDV